MGHSFLRWIAAAALLVGASTFAQAQQKVDIQLVLAVDASGSVNMTRFNLQKHGYAEAFRNPRVDRKSTRLNSSH